MPKLKTDNVLSVCSYSEFEPISFDDGKGYEAELLKAVAKEWGIEIKFYPTADYDNIWLLPSDRNARCDVAIGGISPDESRIKAGAVFSVPIAHFAQSLLIRKEDYESGRIRNIDSFKNTQMKIGVVSSTTGKTYNQKLAKDHGVPLSVFKDFASESEMLPALTNKKIDAIARGEIGNEFQASKEPSLHVIITKDFNESFAIAVDHSNKALLSALNQALNKITRHGKLGYKQWQENPDFFKILESSIDTKD